MLRPLLAVAALCLAGSPAVAQRRTAPPASPGQAPAAPAAHVQPLGRALWREMAAPRVECRATVQYLTWQWNRYAAAGPVPQGSPLNAFTNPTTQQALEALVGGVSHNPQAAGVYRSCAAAAGIEYLVWVAATASDRQCDMAVVNTNLSWQKRNALVSLNEAIRHWNAGRIAKTVPEENTHVLAALEQLYSAVRHNATAGAAYRACFRERPEEFFQAIRTILAG